MEFISTEDMNKFTELGYTFNSKYTPCNVGSTYHVIVTDKDGNEVVHTQSSYGNGSGHGYAMSGATTQAIAELEAIINGEVTEEEYDTEFLSKLVEWGYITDYGYSKQGELLIMFDSWTQVEGSKRWNDKTKEWEITSKSVYAKLIDLAEKNLLKPSVNKTIKEVEYVFSDSYRICSHCGKFINTEWEGLTYLEGSCEELCDDCLNESDEALEEIIEQAKENFAQALPVMISEDKLKELGYEKLDEETDWSTRIMWGEECWSAHNTNPSIMEELCKKYNGFPKLTAVWQFESFYNCMFPSSTVDLAREELADILSK